MPPVAQIQLSYQLSLLKGNGLNHLGFDSIIAILYSAMTTQPVDEASYMGGFPHPPDADLI